MDEEQKLLRRNPCGTPEETGLKRRIVNLEHYNLVGMNEASGREHVGRSRKF